MRQITTNTELLQIFDLVETNHNTLTPKLNTYILFTNGQYGSARPLSNLVVLGKDVDDYEKTIQTSPEYKEYIRYRLSKFTSNPSKETFKETKVIAWIDIDKLLPQEELIYEAKALPYIPNIVKRTNKGWHLIWVAKEPITDKALLEEFENKFGLMIRSNSYFAPIVDKIDNIMSATRPVYPDLPCYIINENFYDAFTLYTDLTTMYISISNFQDKKANMISPKELSLGLVKSAENVCGIIKVLMDSFSDHDYNEWFNVSFFFALRDLLGDSDAKKEWLEKSRTHTKYNINSDFNDRNTLDQLEYTKNFIVKNKHTWVLPSCEFIKSHVRRDRGLSKMCNLCPVRKVKHVFRYLLKNQEEEYLTDSMFISNGIVYKRALNKEGQEDITSVCKAITPLEIVKSSSSYKSNTVEYFKYQYNNDICYSRITKTPNGQLSLKEFSNIPNYNGNYKAFREYIELLISRLEEQNQVQKIPFLGYDNGQAIIINKHISYTDAIVHLSKDLHFKSFDDIPTKSGFYLPIAKGTKEEYLKGVRMLLMLKDQLIFSAIGHYLTLFSKEILEAIGPTPLNVVQIWRGVQGIGKTQRLLLANKLFTNGIAGFKSTTLARIQNDYHFTKMPLVFDEVILTSPNDVEKLRELVYHITNMIAKQDAEKTIPPITSPVIMAGEKVNLHRIENLFSTGLARRMMVIDITKRFEFNITPEIKEIMKILNNNFGHADIIQEYFYENKEEYIKQFEPKYNKVYEVLSKGGFNPRYYTSLFIHIAQILLNLKFLALAINSKAFTEEDEDALLEFYKLTVKNSSELIETINDETPYAEIENAIQGLTQIFKEERSFKGSLPALLSKAGVSFTSSISSEVVRILTGKRYKTSRGWMAISNIFIHFDGAHAYSTVDEEVNRIVNNLKYIKDYRVKDWFKNFSNLYFISTLVTSGLQEAFLKRLCEKLEVKYTEFDKSEAKQNIGLQDDEDIDEQDDINEEDDNE